MSISLSCDQSTDRESESSVALRERKSSIFRKLPFDKEQLPFNTDEYTFVEFSSGTKSYELILEYIAEHSIEYDVGSTVIKKCSSFKDPKFATKGDSDDDDDEDNDCSDEEERDERNDKSTAGLGLFAIKASETDVLLALHQTIGNPIGTSCGISIFSNIVLFSKEPPSAVISFVQKLIFASESTKNFYFKCFKWNNRHEYWRNSGNCRARSLDSVILAETVKSKIVNDITRFLAPKTKKFYDTHGIPYRRSFLFYGTPGAGKTSLIQALAGHFKRNVSFLQLTDVDMNDSSLLNSIQTLTNNTIVVLEDIDSCFSKDRSNKLEHSKITFSGLLNALDGVGSSSGQIFILTTNLRDQLDPALIRCGRVDVQIEFSNAVDEQIKKMWESFYPEDVAMSDLFVAALRTKLNGKEISSASLQHIFVLNMHSSPNEVMDSLSNLLFDMEFMDNYRSDDKAPKTIEYPY